ncbi:hypothetical protein PV328_011932 [Microctonus aethiopoides]|uniref:Uncharacterized protein n=1 Tax=Microctonus aethiopoides TaxID=144406 RepID=A0AA39KQ75_9HYME|nr:hypothetical protein PV328_011932 [Microctonus aethiopoides]
MSGTISKKLCQASYYWEGADVGCATLMCKINFGSPGWSKRVRRLSQYEIAILKRHQCEVSNYVETLLFDDRNVQVVEDELERFRVRSCWGERHPATDFEDLLWCYEGAIYLLIK